MGLKLFPVVLLSIAVQLSCSPNQVGEFKLIDSEEIPDAQAVVYIYRPSSIFGTIDLCNMNLNSELLGALEAGQYTRVFLEPGKTRFETTGPFQALVTINLKSGGEYFVRQTRNFRPTGIQPRLEHMTKIKAVLELKNCTYVATPEVYEKPPEPPDEEDNTKNPLLPF